jgi:hypothetical protein
LSAPLRPDHQAGGLTATYRKQSQSRWGTETQLQFLALFTKFRDGGSLLGSPRRQPDGEFDPGRAPPRLDGRDPQLLPNRMLRCFSQRKSRGPIVVTRARLRSSRKKGTSTTQPPEPAAFVAQRAARGPRDDKSLDAVNCPYPMWSSATTSCDATPTPIPAAKSSAVPTTM